MSVESSNTLTVICFQDLSILDISDISLDESDVLPSKVNVCATTVSGLACRAHIDLNAHAMNIFVSQVQKLIVEAEAKRAKKEERRQKIKEKVKLRRDEGWGWAKKTSNPAATESGGKESALELAIVQQLQKNQEVAVEDPVTMALMSMAGFIGVLPKDESAKVIAELFQLVRDALAGRVW
jgi:hypothetical protein